MIHEGHEGPRRRGGKRGHFLVSLVSSLRSRIAIIWDAGYYGGGGFLVDRFLGIGVNRYGRFRDPRRARRATKPEGKWGCFLVSLVFVVDRFKVNKGNIVWGLEQGP